MVTDLTYLLVSDLASGQTYILEQARRGSKKLNASMMPSHRPEGDHRIPMNRVPHYIRRAAREALE